MNRFEIGKFSFMAPDQWRDVGDSLEGDDTPFTLAKDDGVGALQFSLAAFAYGKSPDVGLQDLKEMREEFIERRGFTYIGRSIERDGALKISAGSYKAESDYIRIWYCSNGADVILITYVAELGKENTEPSECDIIVQSIK